MYKLFACLLVVAGLLATSSCSKKHTAPVTSGLLGVYAVGWTQASAGGLTAATVWKDGVESFLPNPIPGNTAGAVASAVATSGSDIYVAGYAYNEGDTTAVYWKNGAAIVLGGGRASAITVSGKDVYVVGVDTTLSRLCYWKNGVQTLFGFTTATNYVQCMALVDGSLYIGGAVDTSGLALACYWENGQAVLLGHGYVTSSAAWGMAVSGFDIYFAGEADYRPNVPATSACYWKNGTLVTMAHTGAVAGVTSAQGIAVNGGHVYLAGTVWIPQGYSGVLAPVYWKDSVPTLLDTVGLQQGEPSSIIIDSPNVYVGGWYQKWGGPVSQPALWKNGKQQLAGSLLGGVNGVAFVQE